MDPESAALRALSGMTTGQPINSRKPRILVFGFAQGLRRIDHAGQNRRFMGAGDGEAAAENEGGNAVDSAIAPRDTHNASSGGLPSEPGTPATSTRAAGFRWTSAGSHTA